MKSWPRLVPVGALLALVPLAHAQTGGDPFRGFGFDGACAAAESEGKIVLIDFFTTWCGPCKRLDEVTWKDESVRTWLAAETVALRIDAEQETALAQRFQIDVYPSIVFVQPDGTELGRLVGFRDPETFLKEANGLIAGIHPSDQLKKELDENGWDDPMKREHYADALVRERRYAKALEQYLWCFDHGNENDVGYYGVRLSFLLSDIVELGAKFPSALAELRKRRDVVRQALLGGVADLDQAKDFSSLNSYLKEPRNTLEVYDALTRVQSKSVKHVRADLRAILFPEVIDPLIEDRRYTDVLAGIGDPLEHFARALDRFKSTSAAYPNEEYGQSARRDFVESTGPIYEALLGAKHDDEAAAYIEKILGVDGSSATRKTLAEHARHAGRTEVADAIEHGSATPVKAVAK